MYHIYIILHNNNNQVLVSIFLGLVNCEFLMKFVIFLKKKNKENKENFY
jgi:hypothetical protein